MDYDDPTGASRESEPNETALRVLNLLFILNSSSAPLTTEQIIGDSDLGYGSANRASDLKKFKRDREKLAEHGVTVTEVRPAGAQQTEESRWTIDRANTYATLGVITREDAETVLHAIDEQLARRDIPYRKALLDVRRRLARLMDPSNGMQDGCGGQDRAAGADDRIADAMWSAFALRRKIRFAYRDARGVESTRTLAIWGMFVQHGHSYYVGLDEQSGGVRTFRADRITRAWRPTGSYSIPRWFDIRGHLFLPFDLAGGMTTPIRFTFPGRIGRAEIEALTNGRGELGRNEADGCWTWSVKASDLEAAARFALAHAQAGMRPQAPARLVDIWKSLIDKAVHAHA